MVGYPQLFMKGISVIIPAWNEENNIVRCLKSVTNLDYPLFEVILVDGGSEDRTVELARRFKSVKIINNPKRFTATARNLGIAEAKFDYIAFTDADCIVPEDWLKVMMKEMLEIKFFERRIGGIGGANFAPYDAPPIVMAISLAQQTFLGNFGSVQGKLFPESRPVESISTCNALYLKSALNSVGGFSDKQKDIGEDWELNYRLKQRGYKLYVVPNSFVWHNFRNTFRKFFSNMFRYGLGRAIIIRRYPKTFKLVYLLPLFFLFNMLFLLPFIPYSLFVAAYSFTLNRRLWFSIFRVYILQHFGYALGLASGLVFGERIRL